MKPYLDSIIVLYQCGFPSGKSTTNQMFTLRQILEQIEYNVHTQNLFVDFKQTYYSIIRDKIWNAIPNTKTI